jgi:hypothetical protein
VRIKNLHFSPNVEPTLYKKNKVSCILVPHKYYKAFLCPSDCDLLEQLSPCDNSTWVNNSEHSSAKPFKQKQPLKQSKTGTTSFVQQREPDSEQKYHLKHPNWPSEATTQAVAILHNSAQFSAIPCNS